MTIVMSEKETIFSDLFRSAVTKINAFFVTGEAANMDPVGRTACPLGFAVC